MAWLATLERGEFIARPMSHTRVATENKPPKYISATRRRGDGHGLPADCTPYENVRPVYGENHSITGK